MKMNRKNYRTAKRSVMLHSSEPSQIGICAYECENADINENELLIRTNYL